MEGLLVLTAIYNYSFGLVISYLTGWDQSTVLRVIAVLVLVISLYEYRSTVIRSGLSFRARKVFKRMLLLYFAILAGMGITVLLNQSVSQMMSSYLLSFGTRALAGVFLGAALLNKELISKATKWIEPFSIFYTIVLFIVVQRNPGGSIYSYDIDRQTLSYAGAYSLVLLLYYNYNFPSIDKFRLFSSSWIVWLNYFFAILDLYIIFAGGGRGAFVLVAVVYGYYLIKQLKNKNKRGFGFGLALLILGIIVYVYLPNISAISQGYDYVFGTFANAFSDRSSQDRIALWTKGYEYAKESWFLGNGAGSTAYNVGFYTHNIFVDILVEYGFWGVIISLGIFICVIKKAIKLAINYITVEFLNMVFLCSFIMLLFSGSWYGDTGLWIGVTGILGFEVLDDGKKPIQQKNSPNCIYFRDA